MKRTILRNTIINEGTRIIQSEQTAFENSVFFMFEFDEENFDIERLRYKALLEFASSNGIELEYLKNFPPCISLGNEAVKHKIINQFYPAKISHDKNSVKYIHLSHKKKLVSNNLFFGDDYIKINLKFLKSPYISSKCKNCSIFLSGKCRGLFNKSFMKTKQDFISKYNNRLYNSIKEDYSKNFFYVGSKCMSNCIFCYPRLMSCEDYLSIDKLTPSQVLHFVHYLNAKVSIAGVGFFSSSLGDFFDNPYHLKLLDILSIFSNKSTRLQTNGNNITSDSIIRIVKMGILLSISVHTTNSLLRRKLMRYPKEIDIRNVLVTLKNSSVNIIPCVVPLKDNIYSGDLNTTIKFLISINPKEIYINSPGITDMMDMRIAEQLKTDRNEILKALSDIDIIKNNIIIEEDHNEPFIREYVDYISKITKESKSRFLIPLSSKVRKYFTSLKSENVTLLDLKTTNMKNAVGSIVSFRDYLQSLSGHEEYDVLILPKTLFNNSFKDCENADVNMLWNQIGKKDIFVL